MISWSDLTSTLTTSADASLIIKVTLAALLGLAAARLAGRARASLRHAALTATMAVVVTLPLLAAMLPGFAIEVPVASASPATTASALRVESAARHTPAAPASFTSLALPSTATMIRTVWAMGTGALAIALLMALWRLRAVRRSGLPWLQGNEVTTPLASAAGIRRRVEVMLHDDVAAPLTCGLFRPVILLPCDARDWDVARLRRALVHELEHVRRYDWIVHLVARTACAMYWFHPLVWTTARQLSLEAERACDDAVVAGEESTQYAEQLVALARRMATDAAQPALGMAHRSDLSARIAAVLDDRLPRGRAGLAGVATVTVLAVAIAGSLAPLRALATSALPAVSGDEQHDSSRRPRISRLDRALVEAAGDGDVDDVAQLLGAGAKINAAVAGDGSPLIAAARAGSLETVTFLLERGAEPNLGVKGDGNPLIMAAQQGHLTIVELLLDRGAAVDTVVPGDENALINASAAGHLDVVKLLVTRGADVNARVWVESAYERPQGEWRTPLGMARRGRHAAVVAFLTSAGATQ